MDPLNNLKNETSLNENEIVYNENSLSTNKEHANIIDNNNRDEMKDLVDKETELESNKVIDKELNNINNINYITTQSDIKENKIKSEVNENYEQTINNIEINAENRNQPLLSPKTHSSIEQNLYPSSESGSSNYLFQELNKDQTSEMEHIDTTNNKVNQIVQQLRNLSPTLQYSDSLTPDSPNYNDLQRNNHSQSELAHSYNTLEISSPIESFTFSSPTTHLEGDILNFHLPDISFSPTHLITNNTNNLTNLEHLSQNYQIDKDLNLSINSHSQINFQKNIVEMETIQEKISELIDLCRQYIDTYIILAPNAQLLDSKEQKSKESSSISKKIQITKTKSQKGVLSQVYTSPSHISQTPNSSNTPPNYTSNTPNNTSNISNLSIEDESKIFEFESNIDLISNNTKTFLKEHRNLFQLLLNHFIYSYPHSMKSSQFLFIRSCCNLVIQDMALKTNGECFSIIIEKATEKMEFFILWLRQFFYVLSDKDYWINIEKYIPDWLRQKMDDSQTYFSKRKSCLHALIRVCWDKLSSTSIKTNERKHNQTFQTLIAILEITQWIEHEETAYLFVEIIDKLLDNLLSIHESKEIVYSLWSVYYLLPTCMLTVNPDLEKMIQILLMVIVRCSELLANREIEEYILYPALSQVCNVAYSLFPVSFTKYIREKCISLQPFFMKMMSHVRNNPRIFQSERKEFSNKSWSQIDRKELISEMFLHNSVFSQRHTTPEFRKNFNLTSQELDKDLSQESWWQKISTLQNHIDYHFTSNKERPIQFTEDIETMQKTILSLKNELLVERSLRSQYASYLKKISIEPSRRLQIDIINNSYSTQISHYQSVIIGLKDEIKRRVIADEESRKRIKFWEEKIQDELKNQFEKIYMLNKENLTFGETVDRLKSRTEHLEKEIASKDQLIFYLQAQITSTSAVQEKLKSSQTQLESLKQELQMWESYNKKINDTIHRMRLMNGEMVFQEQYVSGLRQKVNEYQNQNRKIASSLQSKNDLIQKMLQEGEKMKQDNIKLNKMLKQEQLLSKQRIEELEKKCRSLRNSLLASSNQRMETNSIYSYNSYEKET